MRLTQGDIVSLGLWVLILGSLVLALWGWHELTKENPVVW